MQSAGVHPAWSLMEPEFASVLASKTRGSTVASSLISPRG